MSCLIVKLFLLNYKSLFWICFSSLIILLKSKIKKAKYAIFEKATDLNTFHLPNFKNSHNIFFHRLKIHLIYIYIYIYFFFFLHEIWKPRILMEYSIRFFNFGHKKPHWHFSEHRCLRFHISLDWDTARLHFSILLDYLKPLGKI